jgi:phage terminase large subunit-like protein
VAGPHVRAACRRHLRDLQTGHLRGLRFDLDKARHALGFYPLVLRLNGGQFEGMPFELHESQAFIVGSLFGWMREDGTRRFRVAYIEEGKGNGKSPLVAGIGIIGLLADNEPRAEVYAAATKKDQAMILFRDAVAMVEQSPALQRRVKQSGRGDKVWNLYDEKTNSFFRPISADDGQSGPRPHIGLIDEVHEHKTATVVNMMSAGRKWRRQPLIVLITNSGTDRQSVCWEYRDKGTRVCAGIEEDDTLFAYICALDGEGEMTVPLDKVPEYVQSYCRCDAAPNLTGHTDECFLSRAKMTLAGLKVAHPGDDPYIDESCWVKANPTLGTIIQPQYLRDEVNASRGMPSKESSVRRLNFCEWVEAFNPAIPYEVWQECGAEYTLDKFRGMQCVAGIDLSATTDLTSIVLDFLIGDVHWLWPMFWIPDDGLAKRAKKDHVPYDVWKTAGHIYTTPGAAIDKDFVIEQTEALLGRYDIRIKAAPFDRHRIDVLQAAANRVGASWPLIPFGQGFVSMGPAWDSFETKLVERKMRHPRNPCMNWNAANAVTVSDPAGNKKLDKSKATGRIDGMVAGTMAVGSQDAAAPADAAPSIEWL